jgi:hypothetical protein
MKVSASSIEAADIFVAYPMPSIAPISAVRGGFNSGERLGGNWLRAAIPEISASTPAD